MEKKSKQINGVPIVREVDVSIVEYASLGFTAKEISKKLMEEKKIKLQHKSVEARLDLLRFMFDCRNTAHLVSEFIRRGVIE